LWHHTKEGNVDVENPHVYLKLLNNRFGFGGVLGSMVSEKCKIFHNRETLLFWVFRQVKFTYEGIWSLGKVKYPRQIIDLEIDKNKPWDFFDGAYQVIWS